MPPNEEHRKDFGDNPPIIGWGKVKSLKDQLVGVKFKCEWSSDKKAHLLVGINAKFFLIEEINIYQNKDEEKMFDIRKGILNCNSNLLVYLTECKLSSKQYKDSTFNYTVHDFFDNYKIGTR